MNRNDLIERLMMLVGFMLTSARGLVGEPRMYGPFRLLDAAGRVLELMDQEGFLDESLREVKDQVDDKRFGPWTEEALLDEFDELIVQWIERMP